MADTPTQDLLDTLTHVLLHTTDPHVLLLGARSLARHSAPEATRLLASFLRNREFLGRLDDVVRPNAVGRLAQVFAALEERPDEEVRTLCLSLANDPGFHSIDDRNGLLLNTLAQVRPMDHDTVELFEHTNQTGYAPSNALLLLHNASPLALALFERMLVVPEGEARDQDADEDSADTLRAGILPLRTNPVIVALCKRLLARGLPQVISTALVASMYDDGTHWFGPASNAPKAPPWESATPDALRELITLAAVARELPGLSDELRAKVSTTQQELSTLIVASRA